MDPSLSICIPTYNRAEFIGDCLESIIPQLTDQMEIVVLDGASRDRTSEVVEAYRNRCPAIRYVRLNTNRGVDEDILEVVDLARSDYCWLMSDDDLIGHGAVEHVRQRLRQHQNLAGASLNSIAFDRTMSYPVRTVTAISRGRISADHLFQDREECFRQLGVHFGYLSAQIVSRGLWHEVVRNSDLKPYKGTCWILVYMIGCMLQRNPNWLYIHHPCVRNRTGNDSFIERLGTLNRQLVTHESYATVLYGLFDKSGAVSHQVRETLLADRMPRTLANTKANGVSWSVQVQLLKLYTRLYWRHVTYWWKVLPLFFVPNQVFRIVRSLYMRIKSRRRARNRGNNEYRIREPSSPRPNGESEFERER